MGLWFWLLMAVWFMACFLFVGPLIVRFFRWMDRRDWGKAITRLQNRVAGDKRED